VTRRVALDAEYHGVATDHYGNVKVGIALSGGINRNDWDLTWNVPLDAGRLVVGDRVKLDVDTQLLQQATATEAVA
jgi:polyisoprenoid-binding protein YceI